MRAARGRANQGRDQMKAEHALAVAALGFFMIGGILMVRSVRAGRYLVDDLKQRFPREYNALGRPQSGYFDSQRRAALFRLVLQKGYEGLPDPALVERFRRYRRSELKFLAFLLTGFGVFGVILVWLHYFR